MSSRPRELVKRDRRPPKNWRRNMVTAAAFLALLDAVIISGGATATRLELALALTLVVGFLIARIWRANVAMERRAGSAGEAADPQGKQKRDQGRKKSARAWISWPKLGGR
jgi:hypothetical protein